MSMEDERSHLLRDSEFIRTKMSESNKQIKLAQLKMADDAREWQCFMEHSEIQRKLEVEKVNAWRVEISLFEKEVRERERQLGKF